MSTTNECIPHPAAGGRRREREREREHSRVALLRSSSTQPLPFRLYLIVCLDSRDRPDAGLVASLGRARDKDRKSGVTRRHSAGLPDVKILSQFHCMYIMAQQYSLATRLYISQKMHVKKKLDLATLSKYLSALWQFHIQSRKKNMELEGTCC